jgi:hypothetical protein
MTYKYPVMNRDSRDPSARYRGSFEIGQLPEIMNET